MGYLARTLSYHSECGVKTLDALFKCCTAQEQERWALTCSKREKFVTEVTSRLGHEIFVEFNSQRYKLIALEQTLGAENRWARHGSCSPAGKDSL